MHYGFVISVVSWPKDIFSKLLLILHSLGSIATENSSEISKAILKS